MTPVPSPSEVTAAQAYEALHVPAIFREWAPRVASAAAVGPGQRALDVACGTGVLTRELLERVGPGGSVTGLDPGAGMLAVASELAPSARFEQGVAESLPFDDASFDAVVSQFGLMFFRDRVGALCEMLRVLAPGGRLSVAVWAALERTEAYPRLVALLERIAGPRAADALRAPFVLGDADRLLGLFEEAGAAPARIETQTGTARFPSVRVMVEADLRGWLPVMGVQLGEEEIARILAEAEGVLASHVRRDGTMTFAAPAHVVTYVKA